MFSGKYFIRIIFLQKYVLFSVVKGAVSIPLFLYQVRDKRIGTAPLK